MMDFGDVLQVEVVHPEGLLEGMLRDPQWQADFQQELYFLIDQMFETEGESGSGGRWPDSRRVQKVRLGAPRMGPPMTLTHTGELRKSRYVDITADLDGVIVEVGFRKTTPKGYPYGAAHMRGRGHNPVRNPGIINADSQGKGLDWDHVVTSFMATAVRFLT